MIQLKQTLSEILEAFRSSYRAKRVEHIKKHLLKHGIVVGTNLEKELLKRKLL